MADRLYGSGRLALTVPPRDPGTLRSTAGAYPRVLLKRNVETPYPSQAASWPGTANRKVSPWGCGLERSEEANAVL